MEDLMIENFKNYLSNFFSEDTVDKRAKLKELYEAGLDVQITNTALLSSLLDQQVQNEDMKGVIMDLIKDLVKMTSYQGQISLLYELSKEGGVEFE